MGNVYILGAVVIAAYIFQIIFGLRQIKHFNQTYSEMKKIGRVAIGRRSGRIKAGTIVLFAVDKKGRILDARRMQGITVAARFKQMSDYVGQDIHYLDSYHPLVRKENKLLQIAIEDAREVFVRSEAGNYREVPKVAPVIDFTTHLKMLLARIRFQLTKE
ncbi:MULTISPECIES: transcriptional regulator GutM [unclassified Streptococcus]|uniref:transcriptional regulator GutM n=1 Tax=unclassified Streptococcus TaxID=2608887 RepID=UPI001071D884|nr:MULTISPECIES: transcriptional regulator GutM [unclassified Streptococcus]MBF0787440.1 transcriptional regulator GutM [Streptococcus sp. 19428wC2_LYSM12]MCQ9211735.1 transcriptional regulator GutM [Streptococcus sp. B01]MCQ9213076.1 transcriptional regulator GutM [Streptococcus sp. O1]TFV05660.1 transcriptional regulator [Streptococcus sp. LYSM12]